MNLIKSAATYLLRLIIPVVLIPSLSQAQYISFRKASSWEQLLQQAAAEKKLVFVDVYTKWCGPCKLMDERVFTLPQVADFYNTSFVNYKLDAEEGEGIELKKKYGVEVYPTYLFIDPATGTLLHKSTSRQEPDVFVHTGQSALQPQTRSVWLEQQYRCGQRGNQLIKNYSDYLASCYKRVQLDSVVNSYLQQVSYRLTDTLAWRLFSKYGRGSAGPATGYLLANREILSHQYGVVTIDNKIRELFEVDITGMLTTGIYNSSRFSEHDYNALMEKLETLQFTGKKFVMQKAGIMNFYRLKQYKDAGELAMQLPADTTVSKKDLLAFYTTLGFFHTNNDDLEWIKYAVNLARYIAYNDIEKSPQAEIHYNYAVLLEKYIRLSDAAAGKTGGVLSATPAFGEQYYRIRFPGLAPKPQAKLK